MQGTIKGPSAIGGGMSNRKSGKGEVDRLMTRGFSAYDLAVANGFVGSQSDWLESIKGGSVELKFDGEDVLWWKYTNEELWRELVDLGKVINRKIDAAQIDLSTVRLVDELPEEPFTNILYIVRGDD